MSYYKYYKYRIYKEQVSYDNGETWEDVVPSVTAPSGDPIGSYETYEQCTGGTPPAPTCECSIFSASTSITVPNSGGTVTLGTFSDDCLGGFSYSFTTPTGMITSAAVSAGTNVSAYTVTISPNQETTAKTGTITVSYTAGENSCTTSAISISQAAADAPKVILTLTDSSTVSMACDGNPLKYTDIRSLVGNDFGSIRSAEVKDCVTSISVESAGGAFNNASGMTSVTLPSTLTAINDSSFWGCSSLSGVTLPNDLIYIGNDAFRECTRLTNINIPNNVQTIGGLAFYNCTGLTSVTIGTGFTGTTNPGHSFQYCTNLQSVTVRATTPPVIDSFFFDSTPIASGNGTIYVPSASVNAYKNAACWSDYADVIQAIS